MRQELSDAYLRGVKPPAAGRLELRDAKVPGLVLRMTPAGTATWSLRTRTNDGKQTRPALGTWPAMSISAARKVALAALAGIQSGSDPVGAKREARVERKKKIAAGVTVIERMQQWQEARTTDQSGAWSDRYASEVARIMRNDIPAKIGKRALVETTRLDWTEIVATKRKTAPGAAATLYRSLASFLGYAEARGWIDLPLLPRKGASRLAPSPAARERVLNDEELAAVWHAAGREVPKLRTFVRFLILTAARLLEVADISAGEVDQQAGRWHIPGERTKNRAGYVVPLASVACGELATIWPNEQPTASHMLFGRSPRTGFRGFSKLKDRLDIASKVTGWRFHDLRRTARTGMTRLGVPRDHAEAAINHVSDRTALERTYDRHDYAPEVIAALEKWQAHVALLVANNSPSFVAVA
jgi:integrase